MLSERNFECVWCSMSRLFRCGMFFKRVSLLSQTKLRGWHQNIRKHCRLQYNCIRTHKHCLWVSQDTIHDSNQNISLANNVFDLVTRFFLAFQCLYSVQTNENVMFVKLHGDRSPSEYHIQSNLVWEKWNKYFSGNNRVHVYLIFITWAGLVCVCAWACMCVSVCHILYVFLYYFYTLINCERGLAMLPDMGNRKWKSLMLPVKSHLSRATHAQTGSTANTYFLSFPISVRFQVPNSKPAKVICQFKWPV